MLGHIGVTMSVVPKPRKVKHKGIEKWCIDLRAERFNWPKKQYFFKTHKEALSKWSEISESILKNGLEIASETSESDARVVEALRKLQRFNIKNSTDFNITEAIDRFIKVTQADIDKDDIPSINFAVEEYINHRKSRKGGFGGKELSHRSITDLVRLEPFKKKFGITRVDKFTQNDLQNYLDDLQRQDGKPYTNQSKNNNRRMIHTFFSWCSKVPRQWIYPDSNPAKGITFHVKKTIVEVLSNNLVLQILDKAFKDPNPKYLPFFVMGFYSGVRSEEIGKLSLKSIVLDEQTKYDGYKVKIPRDNSKAEIQRAAELHSNGMRWMDAFLDSRDMDWNDDLRFNCGKYAPKRPRAGIDWPSNIMRKMFISNWYVKYNNSSYLQKIVGHGDRTEKDFYVDDMVLKAKAEEYFELKSDAVHDHLKKVYEENNDFYIDPREKFSEPIPEEYNLEDWQESD